MDKVNLYTEIIERLLRSYAKFHPIGDWAEYENQVIIDKGKRYFQLMCVGWKGSRRTYFSQIHLDIKPNGKIWIQEDLTEEGIANELMEKGVPKSDIVLAFYAPFRREDTGFAVA